MFCGPEKIHKSLISVALSEIFANKIIAPKEHLPKGQVIAAAIKIQLVTIQYSQNDFIGASSNPHGPNVSLH